MHQKSRIHKVTELINAKTYDLIEDIVDSGLVVLVSCLGIVTNTLNLIVFTKQGYKDSVNISVLYITVWDLIKCIAGFLHRLYVLIDLVSVSYGNAWYYLTLQPSIYLSLFSSYVSSVLTSYVSIERCVRVAVPFKVRHIFTRRMTLVVSSVISIVIFTLFSFLFFTIDISFLDNNYNRTIHLPSQFKRFYTSNLTLRVYYKTTAMLVPILCLTVLCVSSLTTILNLRRSLLKAYKDKISQPTLTRREQKVTRTLLVVIVVYMVCMIPRVAAIDLASLVEVEYYAMRKYHELFMMVTSFLYLLEYSHASANCFIFYGMSLQYRKTLRSLCLFDSCRTQ